MTCGKDRTLKLWNPYSGLLIKTYPGHGRLLPRCAGAVGLRSGMLWAVGNQAKKCGTFASAPITPSSPPWAGIATSSTGTWPRAAPFVGSADTTALYGHQQHRVNCIAYNEECTALVSGGYDSSVRIWDCRSSSIDPIQVIGDFKDSVTSVVVTPRSIFAGSVDGTVSNYDIRMGLATSDQLGSPVVNIALSADSECMLAVCMDARVRVLDRQSGELLNQYKVG
eukprot:scaffold978_cov392-Prasinococcus_capsulatus_cf.AAC.5